MLHTSLLGDLRVANTAEQAAELQALSAQAVVYYTHACGEGPRRAYRSV